MQTNWLQFKKENKIKVMIDYILYTGTYLISTEHLTYALYLFIFTLYLFILQQH